jgi:hypothetical protein
MIRRMLRACIGAVLVLALAVPDRAAAKPPGLPEDGTFTAAPAVSPSTPTVEVLPMPREEPVLTCPYLRRQRIDRNACQIADPEVGREVLDNLKRLEEANHLLELANVLAREGFFDEAVECCNHAAGLCPGSPCADRATGAMLELAFGSLPPERESEEAAESGLEETTDGPSESGVEPVVSGLMKACHLSMNQGMQHQAAVLARQAYALDPQRVMADPLIYKMHLLSELPAAQPAGASEESEPQTCPYCPSIGKPIHEIVPEKKKGAADETSLIVPPLMENMPFELASDANGGLRLHAECPLAGNVYHLRYMHGSLAIWKTPDYSETKP